MADDAPLRVRVLVLNLRRRPDRLAAVQRALPAEWRACAAYTTDWDGPVDGERIVDASTLANAHVGVYKHWRLASSSNSWWCRDMKKGEIGCAYAHYRVWREAQRAFDADASLECVLVFEDDAYFVEDAVQRLQRALRCELPQRDAAWQLVYLGRVPLERHKETAPHVASGHQLLRPAFSYCTYAYALSRRGTEALLATHFEQNLIPVDEFLAACYVPHPRSDVREMYAPTTLSAWAFHEPIALQRTKNDAGSDTEASAFFRAT